MLASGHKPLCEGHNMRNRCFTSLRVVLLAGIVLLPQAILADDDKPIRGTFTVTYMRPSSVDYCGGAAGTVAIEAQGIGSIKGLGPLFITVKKCFTFATLRYAGMFMLSSGPSGAGDTITGTYAGTQHPGDENGFGPFDGTLTITGGTGRFRHTTSGVLTFTAVASPPSVSAVPGPAKVNGNAYYLVRGKMKADKDER
jgi:hypothetical protein